MNNKWKVLAAVAAAAGLSWLAVENRYTDQFVTGLMQESLPAAKQTDPLQEEIRLKASEYEIKPENARIDRVWKTVPGLNGLKVNVPKSYQKMKKSGRFKADDLVYDQMPPKISLKDLEPAPVYRAREDRQTVSLLINVAWGNEYLQDMLTVLKENNVKATFFLEGRWTKNNPELAKMITEGGHEVGNHSYTHPDMKNISASATMEEIRKTNEVIKAVTGVTCVWFAPPSGSFRNETVKIASSQGMGTVMWSVDTIDWQKPSPDLLKNRVLSKAHPGAFVLMHPTEPAALALDDLIKELKKKNLQPVTVSEALSEIRPAP